MKSILFSLILIASLMFLIGNIENINARELTCADIPTELWHFEEGSGTNAQDSCSYINATLYGDMIWDYGKYGNAVRFNGVNTYVDAGNIFPFNQNMPEFSFSLWVNFTIPNNPAWQTLFRSGYYNPYTEFIEAIQINEGDGNNYVLFMASSSNQIKIVDDGSWHNIVGTFNGTSQSSKLYIDGNFIQETFLGISEITATTSPLYFGFNFDNGFLLNGTLDEIAFFNRTLTQEEVSEYYSDLAISSITATPYFTSAVINWYTNENANGTICYWIDGLNETCVSNPSLVLFHSFALTGLSANTSYNYYVKSCSNICRQSLNYSFQTGYSVISSVYIKDNQIFERSDNGVNFTALCYADDNSFCNSLTPCKLSVVKNGNTLLDNVEMIWHTNYYSYSSPILINNGDYSGMITCTGLNIKYIPFSFKITPNGNVSTSGEAMTYIGLLIILVLFLVLSIYYGFTSDIIYVKAGLLLLAYLFLVGISFVSWNLSADYLTSAPFITAFFRILFFVTLIAFFPLLIFMIIYSLYMMFKIKEIQKLIDRGVPVDEAYERTVKRGLKSIFK